MVFRGSLHLMTIQQICKYNRNNAMKIYNKNVAIKAAVSN